MNKKHTILALLCLSVGIGACEEREPAAFQDISGIYFNNRSSANALLDSTDVTFVYESGDEMEIPVTIQLVGRASTEARPIDIRVSSDDAVEGTDYVLPAEAELPAGAYSLDYVVTLKRTAALKTEKKSISFELRANDYFSLPVTQEVQTSGDTVSTLRYRILFSDMFTSAPAAWEESLLGEFSQQKFELACKVLDIDPADFQDTSLMTYAKQMYVCQEMSEYIKEQQEKKAAGEEYDPDAFDENGTPLTFKKS